jgi:hypothetical protein
MPYLDATGFKPASFGRDLLQNFGRNGVDNPFKLSLLYEGAFRGLAQPLLVAGSGGGTQGQSQR